MDNLKDKDAYQGVFLETAHPIKFKGTVEKVLKKEIKIPNQIKKILDVKKTSFPLKDYSELKSLLLSR